MSQIKLDEILNKYPEETFLTPDGLINALVGVDEKTMRLTYSSKEIINILMTDDGMTEEDALEHFYYNIKGAYVGEKTPIYINDIYEEHEEDEEYLE